MKALYRIVAALGALLIFPILYFQKLFRFVIDLGFMDGYFDDAFSINQIVSFFSQNGGAPDLSGFELTPNLAETLTPLKGSAIACLVFFCIFIAMVFAVFFCSACTNAKKVNLVFSALGAVAVIGTIVAFNATTNIVISGEVPLSSIVNAIMADSESTLATIASMFGLGSAVNIIGELIIFQLSTAFVLSLIVFIFEALWSISFILIELDEYKTGKRKMGKGKSKG